MSATADKARYFLEQSVPELKEYEQKKIFSPEEITSIAKRRSDFEHKINARGSSPSDYAQYAEFEINVDALRRKRIKRLGVKSTTHNGQRRIFFVFDRGTRKFPSDVGLWMQSIEYARRQKAHKKLAQIFTSVLRLHPAKSDLWVYAASFAMEENGDMTEARSYMQRGLRFCKNSRSIWVEYARLELSYMAKIHARRKILGIGEQPSPVDKDLESGKVDHEDGNLLQLPKLTAEDITPMTNDKHAVDEDALQNLDNTPVMSGAIPIAIFDEAMAHFNRDSKVGQLFFDTVADFAHIAVSLNILDHIVDSMLEVAPNDWHTQACHIARAVTGIAANGLEYPAALRIALARMSASLAQTQNKTELALWCKSWLKSQLHDDTDAAVRTVLSSKLRSLETLGVSQ